MKMPVTLAAAAAVIMTTALIYAQNGPNDRNAPIPAAGQNAAGQPGAPGAPADPQQDFVTEASSGNNMEIQVGQFIAAHVQDAQIKQFAQSLVQDHQNAEQKLKQAAQQAKIQVSDQLTPVHKAMLDALQQKNGKELERDFVFGSVADHHMDILEYTWASENLPNAQLKQYASQCIPTLQKHYQTAEELSRNVIGVQDKTTAMAQ